MNPGWARRGVEAYAHFWNARVDGASLSLFRIILGVFLAVDAGFFVYVSGMQFEPTSLVLHRAGFAWWPWHSLLATRLLLGVMMAGGALVAAGYRVRLGFALAILGILQLLLQDGSFFLNHLALCLLICVAGCFLPMRRRYALRLERITPGDATIARHQLYVMVLLFWASYFFGGVAKLRPDWISGQIIYGLFLNGFHHGLLAQLLLVSAPARFWAYSGLLLDLLAPVGFAWRRTRWLTVLATLSFHLLNHQVFNIGLFSYLMVGGMVLYFDPAWPERAWSVLRTTDLRAVLLAGSAAGAVATRRRPPGVFLIITLVLALGAGRSLLIGGRSRFTREGEVLGWRWITATGGHRPCAVRFTRTLRDPIGERPFEAHNFPQREALDHDPSVIWAEARGVLCPQWGTVYARWVCAEASPGWAMPHYRAPPPWHDGQYAIDPDQDLCQAGYSWRGANPWIWR